MHGFCGILGLEIDQISKKEFIKSINLAGTMQIDSVSEDNFYSSVSFLGSSPLKGQRIYKTKDFIFLIAGDLIGLAEVPWEEIEINFLKSNYDWFSALRGVFAFVIFNKKLNKISLFSDHRAQIPVYYGCFDNNFIFSTDLSTFTSLKSVPKFNIGWLYEYLFFYYPVDRTTFFENVNRLRPVSKLDFDLKTKLIKESRYGESFKKSDKILKGKSVLGKFISLFKDRVPNYYYKKGKNLVAISAGFDSRNILSLAPNNYDVQTYTYGVKGCPDLNGVSVLMKRLKMEHKEILFDSNFEKLLPTLIYDVVSLSGGIQPILRATVLYVYKNLYHDKQKISVILGGISGDFYRGILYNPKNTFISPGLNHFFNNEDVSQDIDAYKEAFSSTYEGYKKHIYDTLLKFKKLYGNPIDAETKMNFVAYEAAPKSFGGEVAIASNYFTFRQPFWDIDLMKMAYKTEYSFIGLLKRFKEKKDITYKQYELQAKIIASNPNFKRTYIRGLPIILYTYGNKLLFKTSRVFIRGLAYLKGYRKPKNNLEEWEKWFETKLKKEFDDLLNDDSILLNYIDKNFMFTVKNSGDIHLLGKLATTEIILRLIKSRWNKS